MIDFLILFLLFTQSANYNIWTGEIICDNRMDCLHEQAHKMDADQGWISKSDEFKFAIDTHRYVAWDCIECRDEYSEMVMFFPGIGNARLPEYNPFNDGFWRGGWGGYDELYASIYAKSGGDSMRIPDIFQPFYHNQAR